MKRENPLFFFFIKSTIGYFTCPGFCSEYFISPTADVLLQWFQEVGISVTHSNAEVVCGSDAVFVAVKPHLVRLVLSEISQYVTKKHIVVSVAAGVTLSVLEEVRASAVVKDFHISGLIYHDVKYLTVHLFVFCFACLLSLQASPGKFDRHPTDAKPSLSGSRGGPFVYTGGQRKAGAWGCASQLVALLRFGGGRAWSLDRYPHRAEWERSCFCKSVLSSLYFYIIWHPLNLSIIWIKSLLVK